jgi:LmbE family N-acetylglucosaminyl deacetylase
MLTLSFGRTFRAPRRLLCLGAHSDDIEIGCGGTIMNLLAHYPDLRIYWVVFSAGAKRDQEARRSATLFLKRARGATVVVENYQDGFFPAMGRQIKEFFEELKAHFSPDMILTHYRYDLHQDHRTICELTWNTFRNHLILEYEIPKYDGDLGSPNVFFSLERKVCDQKVRNILGSFKSQRGKQWFTRETFLALMRLRGVECNAPHGAAEAFYGRKLMF